MPFTIEEFRDLARILEERPEWRAELRRLVLTDELLSLPEQMTRLRQETERGFQELTKQVTTLTGQVSTLVEAQRRTEERVGRLEESMVQLAEAQRRTEERVGRLEETVAQLVQSQRELTEAQSRTERTLQQLARQVGGLSETVGGDIEDIAYIVLHDVLRREFGWEVGVLERTWQSWNGEMAEINVFGQARNPNRPAQTIWIVGEAKHNLTLREVERFVQQVGLARQHLQGEVFPVCFCYRARPEVRVRLQELGIRLVFSYGRMM